MSSQTQAQLIKDIRALQTEAQAEFKRVYFDRLRRSTAAEIATMPVNKNILGLDVYSLTVEERELYRKHLTGYLVSGKVR